MTAFMGQRLQGAFTKVLEKQYIKEDLGLLFPGGWQLPAMHS